jgi:pyrroloquinoline quinone biosynthesis protein E
MLDLSKIRGLGDLPKPEPSLGIEAYHQEREKALAADPRRQANYEKYIQANRRSADIDYMPIKLDIENASRCNFRCTMCPVSDWPKGQRAGDMSLDEFKAIIDEQYGIVEIKLQGIGEPTLMGDDFFAMIQYARDRHIWVRTTTNASLLHLRENFRKLVDSGPNEIQISVDGADKETFEKIRRGSNFERVLSNCRTINAYCKEQGPPVTKMWTVVQSDNVHQLEDLVDLAAELEFPSYVLSLNLSDWGIAAWSERNRAITVKDSLSVERLVALIERGAAQDLPVRFWNVVDKYDTKSPDQLCPWPFERTYISSDSRVVPCCFLGNPDVFEFPRAGKSVADTWQGPAYSAFRQAHLDGNIPKVCQGCYVAKSTDKDNSN